MMTTTTTATTTTHIEDKITSRRSIDWRDSGIVIDDGQLDSFYDFNSTSNSQQNISFQSITNKHELATNNEEELVDKLNSKLGIDYNDDDGDTILHLAVVGCSSSIVCDLINLCNVNAVNNMMQTPLHVATLANRQETVALLLKANANFNVRDRRGNTPLMMACSKGFVDITNIIIEFILEFAESKSQSSVNLNEHLRLANFDGQTCIHLAAQANQKTIIQLLVEKYKFDPSCQDSKSGQTIMHIAVRALNVDLVEIICKLPVHCFSDPDYSFKKPLDYLITMFDLTLDVCQREKIVYIRQLIEQAIIKCIEQNQNQCCSDNDFICRYSDVSSDSSYNDSNDDDDDDDDDYDASNEHSIHEDNNDCR